MKNRVIKLVAVAILIAVAVSLFTSCESQPIKSNKDALVSVGTVGDFQITYEELYFLANTCSAELNAKYGENSWSREQLIELINENIVSNYAVLTLAKDVGLSLDSEDIKEKTQTAIDAYIESDFGGKRSNYKKALKEMGVTDNYVRFTIGVDLLYSGLTVEYLKNGVLNDDEAFIRKTINEEFIRTWHIMILNENGSPDNYKKAEEALQKLNSGSSMYEMIGSSYNEDFMLTTTDGYYFARGTMDKAYEAAAYALDINEISGIVESIGQNAYGDTVSCYYIIQRLELEDEYVNKNFDTLKNSYHTSIVYGMVEELRASLKFVPNEYFNSLDLLNLKAPKQTDPVIVVVAVSVGVGVVAVAIVTILIIRSSRRKIAIQEEIQRNKALMSGKGKQ